MSGAHVPLGAKLGEVLGNQHRRGWIEAMLSSLPAQHAARIQANEAAMERMEKVLAPIVRGMFADAANDESVDPEMRAILQQACEPQHQFDWLWQLIAIFGGILAFVSGVGQTLAQSDVNKAWAFHRDVPLSPPQLAAAVVKGWMAQEDADVVAGLTGLSSEFFNILVDATGDAPGPIQLGEMLRRNIIDDNGFVHGVEEGDLRNEWAPPLAALKYGPPGPEIAVAAAVQNQLPIPFAQAVFAEAGIDPGHFEWVYNTHGRPPGLMEAIALWRRAVIGEADVDQVIRESDIKNKYIPALKALKVAIPGLFEMRNMIASGAIGDERALQLLLGAGYQDDVAAGVIKAAHATKTAAHHNVTVSEVLQAFELGTFTAGEAHYTLATLGYDDNEVGFLLGLTDAKVEQRLRQQAIDATRTQFVHHKITQSQASTALDGEGVPPGRRDEMLRLWELEVEQTVRLLSPAQVLKAHKDQVFDTPTATAYLANLGYDDADIGTLIAIDG